MKVFLIIFAPIALLSSLFFLFNALWTSSEVVEPVFVTLPIANQGSENVNVGDSATMQTKLQSGGAVTVPNLKVDRYDMGDGETFVLAGGLDVANPRYALTYFSTYDFYQISLESEPLAETRQLAEQEFQTTLGLDQATLCELDVSVRTSVQINAFFAGQELGLSFCPGSVALE